MTLSRRGFLGSLSSFAVAAAARSADAREYRGSVPWAPDEALPPTRYDPAGSFLSRAEREFLTAVADRLIPPDDYPGASDLGVVDYIDGQLAGGFGRGDGMYMQPPFRQGTPSQGYQSAEPARVYRTAIADIEKAVRLAHGGKAFVDLAPEEQDALLHQLQDGKLKLDGTDGAEFFAMLLQNVNEGYFGDPIYGGNRDMAAWRMIGFPGTRYDYRAWVARSGEVLQFDPVSLAGFPHAAGGN